MPKVKRFQRIYPGSAISCQAYSDLAMHNVRETSILTNPSVKQAI